jgi:ATP-dependent helicase HrpB
MQFPVDDIIPDLKAALASRPCAILVAEPGAGKTTRVPLALLGEPWLSGKKILMLEPRRLAARTAASRMAQTLGEELGATVGYTVRLERKVSEATRIEVVTEGILTRRLQNDPELSDTGLIIFDEFHERSLDGDLGLALSLDVQRGLRDDLKILVMSATLDTEKLAAHLLDAPLISAKGRMFPVETRHLDKTTRQTIVADSLRTISKALREVKGSLLVFLPGEGEIRRVEQALLADGVPDNTDVRPLYGAMALADQDAAIKPAQNGRRKIVLATTIAETSLTIDGVEAVIDTGFKRSPRFDPASGMTALETVRVSQASAEQRKGRAGRVGPGVCYRLWPEGETRALAAHDEAEIRIADLSSLVLELANWGVSAPNGLPWLEQPPAAAFAQAQDLLRQLGALENSNAITDHGGAMARLPLHPRLSHMVIAGKNLGAGVLAADIAAMISERDGLPRDTSVDVETRLMHVRGSARERMKLVARQIRDDADIKNDTADISHGVLLALAYPDRIAQKRGSLGRFRMASGAGAIVPLHDPLAKEDFIAVALLDGTQVDAKVHLAAVITLKEIETHFKNLIIETSGVFWDGKANAVSAARMVKLGALVLEERALTTPEPDAMAAAMVEGVQAMGLVALPWSDAANMFRSRINFLARMLPEDSWPDFSDSKLLATVQDWLQPYLAGMSRKSHLSNLDMLAILRSMVPHGLLSKIEKLAPSRMEVPGGGHYTIDYTVEGDPVLRVRLQEMFGMKSAPQIAGGRARLKIELLSPGGKPVAVTQSMETFWTNAYPDVRKDMRGRYPKHSWPEDPLTAIALAPRQRK